jgi:hypothetical protein
MALRRVPPSLKSTDPGAPRPEFQTLVPSPQSWVKLEPPDRGEARLGSTVSGGSAPTDIGTQVILPGVNFFPSGGTPVDEISDADIAPGATVNVLTFQVPEKVQFRIDGIGFGADDESALRFLTWNLLVQGAPYRAYGNQAAAVGTIVQASPINFHTSDNKTVIVQLTSAAAAVLTYRFVVRVKGWLFTDVLVGG